MTRTAYYITHPQVDIDPLVDVPKWGLNDIGKQRVALLVQNLPRAETLGRNIAIVSSNEVKAMETAGPIAEHLNCNLVIDPLMGENDRRATGFLEPEEFELVANQFFANPNVNMMGWESASDAQQRVVERFKVHLIDNPDYDIIFVGHGAVGTLLYCHLAGEKIDRKFDQTGGGGNFYKINMASQNAMTHWQSIESFTL